MSELDAWLASVRVTDVIAAPVSPWEAPGFAGPLLRSALGLAAHQLGCGAAGCGEDVHRPDCRFETSFHGDGRRPPPFRLDTRGLDGRRLAALDPWRLRLVTYDPNAAGFLLDSVMVALETGLGRDRIRQQRIAANVVAVEPLRARAERWAGRALSVRLVTPTLLERQGNALAEFGPLELLHFARLRAQNLGVPRTALPRYEDHCEVLSASGAREFLPWDGGRLATVRAQWTLVPTPAQALWLALADVTGVGKHVAFGLGVVECTPA